MRSDSVQLDDELARWIPPLWSLHPPADGPLQVLVVEPRSAVRRQIGRALRRAGMRVEFASGTRTALELIESRPFDVAVVDPCMERWRGLEVCRRAARGHLGKPIPVVTLAASHSWICALRCRLAGARMQFTRPVGLEQFVACVWSVGNRWSAPAPLLPETA